MKNNVVKKRGKTNKAVTLEQIPPPTNEKIVRPESLPSNLILHLKKMPNIESNSSLTEMQRILSYDPSVNTPNAYDPVGPNEFSYVDTCNKDTHPDIGENSNVEKKQHVDEYCWWCCHTFSNDSLRLPIRKNADASYDCVGLFCSPECTCSYIMDSGSRFGERWKQYELLHEMIKVNKKIEAAPNRELLKVFGGHLSIEEFRSNNKDFKLVYPPMVSLKMQMDDTPIDNHEVLNIFAPNGPPSISNLDLNVNGDVMPEKRKKKKTPISGSLDRFWTME